MKSAREKNAPSARTLDIPRLLAEAGLRNTQQRRAIWTAAYTLPGHFTAEELLEAARRRDSSVSRATVYRSLPALVASGIVTALDVGRDFRYYESTSKGGPFKGHIVCDNCEKIIEFDAPFMDWYGRAIVKQNGLEFVSQHLQITAHCPNCTCEEKTPPAGKKKNPRGGNGASCEPRKCR